MKFVTGMRIAPRKRTRTHKKKTEKRNKQNKKKKGEGGRERMCVRERDLKDKDQQL